MESKSWSKVVGFEEMYEINKKGEVKSIQRKIHRSSSQRSRAYNIVIKERILKPVLQANGYFYVTLSDKQSGHHMIGIHQLLCRNYIENKENKKCVNHKDGNKLNNNLENLEWCTYSENTQHAYNTGLKTQKKGKEHYNFKLSSDIVDAIKKIKENSSLSNRKIAKIFNFSHTTINKII